MNSHILTHARHLFAICLMFCAIAVAQTPLNWTRAFTSTDGRQLQAAPISKTDTSITVRREDGQTFILQLDKLSPADQSFVKAWTAPASSPAISPAKVPENAATGPVAGRLVIVPINEGAPINPLGAGAFENEPLKDSLFADVDACDHHVLAVTADGKAVCFGMDQDGKPMVDVLPKTKRKMVACTAATGRDFLMDEDGHIEVMRGEPFETMTSRTKARRIFLNGRHEVAFAMNSEGRLQFVGHPNDRNSFDFPPDLKDTAFRSLYLSSHIVGITTEGKLHVWGSTGNGQLPLPEEIADAKVSAVGLRGSTTIAVRDDGKIVIWGEDRKWWDSKLSSAPGTVEAWDLTDGYWGATIFRQETPQGRAYTVYSNSNDRDVYLKKLLDLHQPVKIRQTRDAIIMISDVQ